MDKTHDILFLKFNIPNSSQIVSIESFVLHVVLYDNADGGGESGDIEFAQPGANFSGELLHLEPHGRVKSGFVHPPPVSL